MPARTTATLALALAAGCEMTALAPAADPLPVMGGYRAEADQCRRIGENAFTNQFLDDSADLVGCPLDYEGIGVFVTETGAIAVAEAQGYRLFTVPRG